MPYLFLCCSKESKKRITIASNREKAELFDRPQPLAGFWTALLCRGGGLVDEVSVLFNTTPNKDGADRHSAYRWYPRTLIKTLLLVSAFFASAFIESLYASNLI